MPSTRAALLLNSGSRGWIQLRYRQGLRTFSARTRWTLRRLMPMPSPLTTSRMLEAKWRLRGRSRWLGSSHATAITIARSTDEYTRGRPRRARSVRLNPSSQRRRHWYTHWGLCPRRRAASGLDISECRYSNSASRARCTSMWQAPRCLINCRHCRTRLPENLGRHSGIGPPRRACAEGGACSNVDNVAPPWMSGDSHPHFTGGARTFATFRYPARPLTNLRRAALRSRLRWRETEVFSPPLPSAFGARLCSHSCARVVVGSGFLHQLTNGRGHRRRCASGLARGFLHLTGGCAGPLKHIVLVLIPKVQRLPASLLSTDRVQEEHGARSERRSQQQPLH